MGRFAAAHCCAIVLLVVSLGHVQAARYPLSAKEQREKCPMKSMAKVAPVDLGQCYQKLSRSSISHARHSGSRRHSFADPSVSFLPLDPSTRIPIKAGAGARPGAEAAAGATPGALSFADPNVSFLPTDLSTHTPIGGLVPGGNRSAFQDGAEQAFMSDEMRNITSGYNTFIGAAYVGPTYQFTPQQSPLEGAKIMAASGAKVHKFLLKGWLDKDWQPWVSKRMVAGSLAEAAQHPDLGYQELFDLPFSNFVFWANAINKTNVYNEFYDLATYLIKKHAGTGKSFYIGHWEGDWNIRRDFRDPVIDDMVQHWIQVLSDRQRAVDAAKADLAHLVNGGKGVRVWSYAEVNKVMPALRNPGYKCFLNQVVPHVSPPIDFVSYSNWEMRHLAPDELGPTLVEVMDFINCHIPAKSCVPQPRAYVGEYGYALRDFTCRPEATPPVRAGKGKWGEETPDTVRARTLWLAANVVAQGAPFALHWQLYCNEIGTDPASGRPCNRGLWLVDTEGGEAPLFAAFKDYFAASERYLAGHAARHNGSLPDANAFRRWAVAELARMSGYDLPAPEVRELDLAAATLAGGALKRRR